MKTMPIKEYEKIPLNFKVTFEEGVIFRTLKFSYGVGGEARYFKMEKDDHFGLVASPKFVKLTKE